MRLVFRSAFAVGVLLLITAAPIALAGTFTEDFTTTTFRDSVNTTADWNIADGELKLLPLPTLVGSHDTPGTAYGVAVAGNLAFVADFGSGLQIIDISDPAAPSLVGNYDTPGAARGVAVAGDLAFVADNTSGLQIIDISDPAAPFLVASYGTTGSAQGVAVAGNLAYVACSTWGLQIIDITNPAAPAFVGSYDTPGAADGIALAGDLAFIADYIAGLQIIDISDPTAPTLVGNYNTPGLAFHVVVAGDLAYVADGNFGLQIIDITTPAAPALFGSYDTPGSALGVTVDGDRAFVADNSSGLQVIDITDPAAPAPGGSSDTPGAARGVAVAGELAFVADGASGLQVVRIADFIGPTLVGNCSTPGSATRVVVAGDLAFVLASTEGLQIISISNPAAPVFVGSYDTPGSASNVTVAGALAFVADGASGLQIIDISDHTAPALVANYAGLAGDVAVAGDLAFVTAGSSGLQLIDISDPAAPALVSSCNTLNNAIKVVVAGDLAFVLITQGLQIIDITDTAAPVSVGSYNTPNANFGLAVAGNLAFVTSSSTLQIIDITDPASPALVGSINTPGGGNGVAVAGDLAFVASGSSGLQIIDITDPAAPVTVGNYNTPSTSFGVAVAGNLAFVTDLFSGLMITKFAQYEFATRSNAGRSLAVDSADDTIMKARLATAQAPGVSWELSADNGTNWQPILPDNNWNAVAVPGSDLLWRSTHTLTVGGLNPVVSDLRLEWLADAPAIDAITDVPNDQGGRVYLTIQRSAFDFAAETTLPITQYGVYRLVEGLVAESGEWGPGKVDMDVSAVAPAELPGEDVRMVDGVRYVISTAKAAGTFPPGTWVLLTSVPATQRDLYLAEVTTAADSSAAGPADAVFLLTAHTTTPSQWFVSVPVSGHSVDNLAPGVPQGLAAAYVAGAVDLSWAAAPEPDFQFFRVYRSTDPAFIPGPGTLVHETATNSWQDTPANPGGVHYKVTALDHAGNESQPAATSQVSAVGDGPVGTRLFALHANHPNPFNPRTTISFDLPQAGPVELAIYDVTGRRVRTLLRESRGAGTHEVIWPGTNDDGRQVASGVYLYELRAGSFVETKRMTLLK